MHQTFYGLLGTKGWWS